MTNVYSFDSSSFINGRRDLLPPDLFATVWRNIEHCIQAGRILAVDVVKDEVGRRDDSVKEWVSAQSNLFVELEPEIQAATRLVLQAHPKLMGTGGGRNGADPFVIALAISRNGVVVTEETMSGRIEKPRIPDVCEAMGVPWVNLVGFIRQQGWRF